MALQYKPMQLLLKQLERGDSEDDDSHGGTSPGVVDLLATHPQELYLMVGPGLWGIVSQPQKF